MARSPQPDLLDSNVAEFTVSELSTAIKRTLEDSYGYVRVRGEIGRLSRPGSGHLYLDLKDDKAVIAAVVWKGVSQKLIFRPEEGLEVVASGRVSAYAGQSKYQLIIERLEPAGVGALMALLEERKKKLAAEGLFDEERKAPLPFLPRVVGIVTSPTGAVIRDMLHGFDERFPTHVLVWPVRVQGETSAREVAAAIHGFNGFQAGGGIPRPDLIIVARGGGSLEDLWSFNEEIVARAAAASEIPLISAVGHETDWTLIDYVADARAPTPTKAAEWAVPMRSELETRIAERALRLRRAMAREVDGKRSGLQLASRGLPRGSDLFSHGRQRLDLAALRLPQALARPVQRRRRRLQDIAPRSHPQALAGQIARLSNRLARLDARGREAMAVSASRARRRLEGSSRRLVLGVLLGRIEREGQRMEAARIGLARAFHAFTGERRRTLEAQAGLLAALSYRAVLGRGFALVRDDDDRALRRAADIAPGSKLAIEFADGRIGARADGEGEAVQKPKRGKRSSKPKDGQQSLF